MFVWRHKFVKVKVHNVIAILVRGVFKSQLNIYDEPFVKTANRRYLFLQKDSTTDFQLGSKHAFPSF